jgi:hypothetical protein
VEFEELLEGAYTIVVGESEIAVSAYPVYTNEWSIGRHSIRNPAELRRENAAASEPLLGAPDGMNNSDTVMLASRALVQTCTMLHGQPVSTAQDSSRGWFRYLADMARKHMHEFSGSHARFAVLESNTFTPASDDLPDSKVYGLSELLEWRAQWLASYARALDAPINTRRVRGAFVSFKWHMFEHWETQAHSHKETQRYGPIGNCLWCVVVIRRAVAPELLHRSFWQPLFDESQVRIPFQRLKCAIEHSADFYEFSGILVAVRCFVHLPTGGSVSLFYPTTSLLDRGSQDLFTNYCCMGS